ncbi:MAG: hypothetical protein ACLQJ7_02075 [Syntrophobacteraceae bacterium]
MAETVYEVNYRNITIKISDGATVSGKVNLQNYRRLSDMLKSSNEKFITVVLELAGESSPKAVFINKDYIILAEEK